MRAMRRKLIAGNWKMNLGPRAGAELARAVVEATTGPGGAVRTMWKPPQVIVCPPFVSLIAVAEALRGSTVGLGAQNLHWERQGAFTGEIAGEMLVEVGCRYVIVGHSERRQLFGETDEIVARKARAALDIGLTPIVCVGETLAEREGGQTAKVVERQLGAVYDTLDATRATGTIVAYEPVWAIGTGRNATAAQAVEVHARLREALAARAGAGVAAELRILYGGSVNAGNAVDLLREPEIDGALVGGASLKTEEFGRLIQIGAAVMK
jgi:triosephosphate isomerase